MTVPYGIHAITPNHRVYDRNVLTSMLAGFRTVASQSFRKKGLPCSSEHEGTLKFEMGDLFIFSLFIHTIVTRIVLLTL